MADEKPRRGLFDLIAEVPRLIGRLIQAEIDAVKAEFVASAKRAGVGVGLLGAAVFLALVAVVTLVFAAVAGLAEVLPFWAAALIVAGALLGVGALLASLGVVKLQTAAPDVEGAVDRVADDFRLLRGEPLRGGSKEASE